MSRRTTQSFPGMALSFLAYFDADPYSFRKFFPFLTRLALPTASLKARHLPPLADAQFVLIPPLKSFLSVTRRD